MLLVCLTAAALLGVGACLGDASAPTAPEPNASGDGSSASPHRPQFHYTPPRNWMNDPNGLVYHDGTYHLFHQYNPEGSTWGHMSWYHATSTDLVHWTHEGVAIPESGSEMIFSGSAVVDPNNTSGFGTDEDVPPLVAVYTSHYRLPDGSFDQAQSLAYSTDGGETWAKYEGNPVLQHPEPDFRDPNVFWYEPDARWLMVVALPEQRKVQFYASDNLRDWTHLSDFGPAGATGGIWECPALVRVPVEGRSRARWVLQVDVYPDAAAGGSGGQYFVGTFDGTTFTPDDGTLATAPHWVDYGPDFYAAIPWNNVPETDGRALWIGWMSNWTYAERLPPAPWRSAQTIPRSVHLRPVNGKLRLVQRPIEELRQLREAHTRLDPRPLEPGLTSLGEDVTGRTLELVAEFEPADAETVGLLVRAADAEQTVIGYDADAGSVFVDRTASGTVDVHDAFAARDTAPLRPQNGRVTLHVFVDQSSVEVFANDGARVLTHRIFPAPSSDGGALFAAGGTAQLVRLDVWTLRSIWSDR